MTAIRLGLLVIAVAGVLIRRPGVPAWGVPVLMVVAGLALGAFGPAMAGDALDPMVEPLGFLLLAVPLAVMLDRLGFFTAVAARIDHRRHLHLGLWLFAAAVTTLFNLDASVVLLTPLYVRIARRHGLDPVALGFMPILLACFASSALPVSNLTNLLAVGRFDLGTAAFASRLGPASAAATAVGYGAYRRVFRENVPSRSINEPFDPRALRLGAPVVLFVLVGFTVGDVWAVPAWVVAGVADVVLVALTRRVPWSTIPWNAAILAASLGVLAASASPSLHLDRVLGGTGSGSTARIFVVSAFGANALNNLPALLVSLPALGAKPGSRLWALLLGVNLGPVLAINGSLAGLLWLDTARRLGVPVDARTYSRVGWRVGLPALSAGFATLLVTNRLLG
jgi:arsenical pump membrane protein